MAAPEDDLLATESSTVHQHAILLLTGARPVWHTFLGIAMPPTATAVAA